MEIPEDFSITSFSEVKSSLVDVSSGGEDASSTAARPIPKPTGSLRVKRRGRSQEEPYVISSTPEGERYFQQQAEILYEKAAAGDLDVRVPDVAPDHDTGLVVKVGQDDARRGVGHVEVADLSAEPSLAVKPLRTAEGVPLSSFEALYDTTQLEAIPGDVVLGAEELRLGDKFQGTKLESEVPGMSSFENIYQQSDEMLLGAASADQG